MDFIRAHVEHEKESLRMQALMQMTQLNTLSRMLSGKMGKASVMNIYDFLWTKQERQQAKVERLKASLEAKCNT